ncbi:MAG: c-type cytochrome [Nannocystaceae bacterium]
MVRAPSRTLVPLVFIAAAGCGAPTPARDAPTVATAAAPAPWSDAWLIDQAHRYLEDPAHRRRALEASLTNPENHYSSQRLSAYGLGDRGWDLLPEWNPRSLPVDAALVDSWSKGQSSAVADAPALWDGRTPSDVAGWAALGRAVFFDYPLRPEPAIERALAARRSLAAYGVTADADGVWIGARAFLDVDGRVRVGITCALCHAAIEDGATIAGAARRSFDYGALLADYHDASGDPVDPELRARMVTWGPGRADITEDEAQDPVAIPDLWDLRSLSTLTQAGTVTHAGPAALAIRQETQIIHAGHERARPPRALAFALAVYLYQLTPPPRAAATRSDATDRGAALFARRCQRCHRDAAHSGPLVPASTVGTDPALADGAARGTGRYRPAPLVRVADAAPYLHDGSVATLEALLEDDRLEPDYPGGARGPGPVPGHSYGLELGDDERAALLAYLRTL